MARSRSGIGSAVVLAVVLPCGWIGVFAAWQVLASRVKGFGPIFNGLSEAARWRQRDGQGGRVSARLCKTLVRLDPAFALMRGAASWGCHLHMRFLVLRGSIQSCHAVLALLAGLAAKLAGAQTRSENFSLWMVRLGAP